MTVMKIVRFISGKYTRYGVLEGDYIRVLKGTPYPRPRLCDEVFKTGDVMLLSPCTPSKIVALGFNYRSHVEEIGARLPEAPLIFLKPPTAVIGPEEGIIYPPSSQRVDYEGELGVVLGRRAWRVPVEAALDYILGYTCCNDVTARDLQYRDKQWTRAKGFDTFAAIGPCIETDLDPGDVTVETYLNGELKQRASTADLIFPVPELVSFISNVMTLLPGDVIATGTPSGIGPMRPGDMVEVRIVPIGTLRNCVVAGE